MLLAHGASVAAQPPLPRGSDFYGINFVPPQEPWLTLARNSGARVVRWQFNWRDYEIAPGQWDWSSADAAIRAWNNAGLKVHALLHNPPDFALAHPGSGLMPVNISLPWNHPDNGWGRFCYEFARRYRGQVASYEIWNEPDLDQYWEGTAQDYFYLLRSCYPAIKAADPGHPVAMAGLTLVIDRNFFPEVVRLATSDPNGARYNFYFDVANIHLYASSELAYSLTLEARSVLDKYGLGYKPVWITETNVALRGYGTAPSEPHWGYATEEEAGWYILQAIGNAYAAGVERFMVFRLSDADMDTAFGLVRNDGSLRPGYRALQTAATFLINVEEASRELRGDVVLVTMKRTDGARIVVVWSRTGQAATVEVTAGATAALLINAAGGASTVQPNAEGVYAFNLPPAHGRDLVQPQSYGIGGPPLLIIEQDRDPPTVVLDPILISLDPTHVLIRWVGDDGRFGTGVASYEVEISRDGGPWQQWQAGLTTTEVIYELTGGGTIAFRVRAIDRAGNIGPFSEPSIAYSAQPVGVLVAHIVDLRGQGVPYARVTLSDGTLHDADETGVVRVTLPDGSVRATHVDGSAHGRLVPDPVEIEVGQEVFVEWMLLPYNLLTNGEFDLGLQGWRASSPGDVQVVHSALRLSGQRRPWGGPAATTTIVVPPGMGDAVLSFLYRLPEAGGQVLRLRAITSIDQAILWQTATPSQDFTRIWLDMGRYAGHALTLSFELWGPKGALPGTAEVDRVILGGVPVLPTPPPSG